MLKTLIPETVKAWASKGEDDLSVLLSEKDLAALEAGFTSALKSEIEKEKQNENQQVNVNYAKITNQLTNWNMDIY